MTITTDEESLTGLAGSVEAASYAPEEIVALGVPRGTVDAWVHRKRVTTVRFGSGIRIPRDQAEYLIAERAARTHPKRGNAVHVGESNSTTTPNGAHQ